MKRVLALVLILMSVLLLPSLVRAEEGWIAFEAESFSIYAVTRTIEKIFTAGDGQTYLITLTYDSDAGIPDDAAQQIITILNENNNLRTVYNKMRVAFGGDTGRKYYQIVKEVGRG